MTPLPVLVGILDEFGLLLLSLLSLSLLLRCHTVQLQAKSYLTIDRLQMSNALVDADKGKS